MRPTLTLLAALLTATAAQAAEVNNLRCENRESPLGVDSTKPRLSWKIEVGDRKSEARSLKQTAYQVLVASSEKLLKKDKGDLWDSGKVASGHLVGGGGAAGSELSARGFGSGGAPLSSSQARTWKG